MRQNFNQVVNREKIIYYLQSGRCSPAKHGDARVISKAISKIILVRVEFLIFCCHPKKTEEDKTLNIQNSPTTPVLWSQSDNYGLDIEICLIDSASFPPHLYSMIYSVFQEDRYVLKIYVVFSTGNLRFNFCTFEIFVYKSRNRGIVLASALCCRYNIKPTYKRSIQPFLFWALSVGDCLSKDTPMWPMWSHCAAL